MWFVREWPSSMATSSPSCSSSSRFWNVLCKKDYPLIQYVFLIPHRVGFPIMIGSIIVTTGYLLVSHSLFAWH